MTRSFEKYKVKIITKSFDTNYFQFPNTAQISFFDSKNKITEIVELAYADNNFLKKTYTENKQIILDNCYIKNFDIEYVRQSKNNNIKIFSAENTFFDSHNYEINFSNITLINKIISFKKSIFIASKINFENTKFKAQTVNLEYLYFKSKDVIFYKSVFYDADISFKNSLFIDSNKNFKDITFGKGRKNFEGIDFNSGDTDFSGTDFGPGKKSFRGTQFRNGKVDFQRVKFNEEDTSFENIYFGNGDISFKSAEFKSGKVNFNSAEFGEGKKDFTNTDFGTGNIIFKNVNFANGKVSFRMAFFGDGFVDFHYAKFGNGKISFDYAKFTDGGINFSAVDFGTGDVSFANTFFGNGNISFEASELSGKFTIKDSVLGNGEFNFQSAEFNYADIEIINVDFGIGKVSFKNSIIKNLSLKESQLDNYFDLRVKKCNLLDLSDTVIKDIIDISPLEYKSTINEFNFSGMRLLGRIYLDWKINNVKEIILKQKSSNNAKSEQFRILKENYNQTGQYSYEDQAYVEFKRSEAKAHREIEIQNKKLLKIKPHLKYWFQWLIFDKMGKYATDPLRVLITMIITYIAFTFIYILFAEFGEVHIISSLFNPSDPRVLNPIARAFYHSAITFLTIGYGDYYPDGISRWISAIEGFTGLFLMSYFTVAFVRKVLR